MAGEKVLFIDGDEASRKYVAASLRRLAYEVITAESGKEALVAARGRAPALVLVDPDLPDMTGEELAARLRAQPNTAATPLNKLDERALCPGAAALAKINASFR